METKDLLLRNWQDTDAEPLYEMCLDPALRASGIHFYDSVADSQNTILNASIERFIFGTFDVPANLPSTYTL